MQICEQFRKFDPFNAVVSIKLKKPSLKERKQKLLIFLQEKYESICAKWTMGCAK
ncbi:Histone-lysine N-methyltransferase [Arachis hypogaea]|nr:Histone-lysine N-methyltransferase [Arachis hypogaea]